MAQKNATGINENIDHPNQHSSDNTPKSLDQVKTTKTEVKNAHASGLGSMGRSEENNIPKQDGSHEEEIQDY